MVGVTRPVPETQWRGRRDAHQRRVDGWTAGHLARRERGEKHPVADFLFTYYSYRPSQLRRWHPGAEVELLGADAGEFGPEYRSTGRGATLDTAGILSRRGDSVSWIAELQRSVAARPAHLGCFGMHEWAMVYRAADQRRHEAWPLRLSPADTARVVEQNRVRCSHFDAYRFFTPAARPLNVLTPTRERQRELEQPGCLHANMDLYKWASKLMPFTPSSLLLDCFELARDIRTLDMQASPYDLAPLGYAPVRIETPEGKAEYTAAQRTFADRARPLRRQLVTLCDALLG